MPKDEFDFQDPFELQGVALLTSEDTTEPMCECFVEEFMRMGYDGKQILSLFRNPYYLGMNMVLQNRGEAYVRAIVEQVFARWGRNAYLGSEIPPTQLVTAEPAPTTAQPLANTCDPLGNPAPDYHT